MKKSRVVVGLILNLLIVAAIVFGVLNGFLGFLGKVLFTDVLAFFQDFTNVSGVFIGVVALFALFADFAYLGGKKPGKFITTLKLMAITTSVMAMIYNLAFYAPKEGWDKIVDYQYLLYPALVAPVLGIIDFIVENRAKLPMRFAFIGMLPTLVYFAVVISLANLKVIGELYDFLLLKPEIWLSIVWWVGIVLVSYVVATILVLFHRGGAEEVEEKPAEAQPSAEEGVRVEEKEEIVVENKGDDKKDNKKDENKADEAKPAAPESGVAVQREGNRIAPAARKTFHIKKGFNGKWQVVSEPEGDVIEEFESQAEALAYAKGLIERDGGNYRVHMVRGRILR